MKKIIMFILATGLVVSGPAYTQQGSGNGKGKGNNKTEKNQNNKDKNQGNDKDKPGKDKDNPGKGHAYGKDKDSLSGREFGQNRAAEARSKKEAVEQTEANISEVTQANTDTKEKIKQAREKLEAKKKNKQINQADYNKKKQALDDLEKEVDELEKQNNEIKSKLGAEKEKN